MQRTPLILSLWIGLASAPFACSDSETAAGTGANTGKPCDRDADCADDDNCTFDFCIDGFCQNNQASNGAQPSELQTEGDCKELRCEGGVSVEENDDDDTGDDNDDTDCLIPVCNNGTPEMGPAEEGSVFCQVGDNLFGACDGAGTCSCAPSSSDITVFVDGVNGTDSVDNGAGFGACAYATVDFALSQANGEIILIEDTYDSTNVTLPITLTGNQQLRCDYDYDNDQFTTSIVGSGPFGASTATIVFEGTTNRVNRCIVDGNNTAEVAIAINSASVAGPNGDDAHAVANSRITNATTGVEMTATGDVAFFSRCEIANNTTTGLLFTGGDKVGYLDENDFSGNGTDVVCSDPSPELAGDNNGAPSCTGCDNCPF